MIIQMQGRAHCAIVFWRRHDLPALGQLQHDGGRHRQLGNHVAAAPWPSRFGLLSQVFFLQSTPWRCKWLERTFMLLPLDAQNLVRPVTKVS